MSRPWKEKHRQEPEGEHDDMTKPLLKAMGRCLSRFILTPYKGLHFKIPYFYKEAARIVLAHLGDKAYELPPLADLTGLGWVEKLQRDIALELESPKVYIEQEGKYFR